MNKIVEILISYLFKSKKKPLIILLLVTLLSLIAFGNYYWHKHLEYKLYHSIIESPSYHFAGDIYYDHTNYNIRLYWEKLPKVLNLPFTEIWSMSAPHNPLSEYTTIRHWRHGKNRADQHYKKGISPLKTFEAFWGDPVFVGKLEDGIYYIKIEYIYEKNLLTFGVKGFTPEQKVKLKIKHSIQVREGKVVVLD